MFPHQGGMFQSIMGLNQQQPMMQSGTSSGISLAALAEEERRKKLLLSGLPAEQLTLPPVTPVSPPVTLIGDGITKPTKDSKARARQYTSSITDPKLRKQEKERQRKAK